MIDLKLLREDPDAVRRSQRARGEDPALVDVLLDADADRRAAVSAADNLRAEQKAVSKRVGSASPDERPAVLRAGQATRRRRQGRRGRSRPRPKRRSPPRTWRSPTSSSTACPPAARTTTRCSTPSVEPPTIDDPKDHVELGESLGLIDMERGAKVSGSRFYFLTGPGALLQLGLLQSRSGWRSTTASR